LLDVTRARAASPETYWEPVSSEDNDRLVLTPQKFYLLMSREAVVVHPELAAEMTAYDPTSGELRTHYAGFFDPGFGFDAESELKGSRAALEVRAHEVPSMVAPGQMGSTRTFQRLVDAPT